MSKKQEEKKEVSAEKPSLKETILNNETIKELAGVRDMLRELVSSDNYQKLIAISEKIRKLIDEDNANIDKTGKSAYYPDQKQAMGAEFCSINTLDASVATLINVVSLRYNLEYQTLEFQLSEKEEKPNE